MNRQVVSSTVLTQSYSISTVISHQKNYPIFTLVHLSIRPNAWSFLYSLTSWISR